MELGKVGRPAGNQHQHHHGRRHGQPNGDATGVLGPKKINRPDGKNGRDGPFLGDGRFLKPEVVEPIQATQRGGDDKVREQQQAANRSQPPRVQARRRYKRRRRWGSACRPRCS